MTSHQKGLLTAHIAAFLFGLSGIFGALIQTDPIFITFGRAVFACLCLCLAGYLFNIKVFSPIHESRQIRKLLYSGVMLAIHWSTFFVGIKIGGVAMATLGFAGFPAFITLLERFALKDRVTLTAWVLVLVVMLGLVLVAPEMNLANANTSGLIWGIISGIAFAVLAVINRTIDKRLNPVRIAFWQNLVVSLVTLPLLAFVSIRMSNSDWVYLALLGILSTALSHYLFVNSLRHLTARTAGLIIALEPVYAIMIAWYLFNEAPTLKMLIGGALIIGAAIYPQQKSNAD